MTKCPSCEKDIDHLIQNIALEPDDIETEVKLVDGTAENILTISEDMALKYFVCPECGYEFPFYSKRMAEMFLMDSEEELRDIIKKTGRGN